MFFTEYVPVRPAGIVPDLSPFTRGNYSVGTCFSFFTPDISLFPCQLPCFVTGKLPVPYAPGYTLVLACRSQLSICTCRYYQH